MTLRILSNFFIISFVTFGIILMLITIHSIINSSKKIIASKKYIKNGGLDQPKTKITKVGSNKFIIEILSLTKDNYKVKNELEYQSLNTYLSYNSPVKSKFNEIIKTKIPNLNSSTKEFASLEKAKLVINCLYEAHEKIAESKETKIIIDDYREEYNQSKKEKHILTIKEELRQYNLEKSKKL